MLLVILIYSEISRPRPLLIPEKRNLYLQVVFVYYTSAKSWRGYIFTSVCLSVCLLVCECVCLSLCLSVSEQISNQTDAPILTLFSLKCLLIALRTMLKLVVSDCLRLISSILPKCLPYCLLL